MPDIDSKKDNSTKIGDYGKKLGSSIFKFCILILLGCLVLYASKACGTGILEVIMQTYYVKGLTDDFLLGSVDPCKSPESTSNTETQETESQKTESQKTESQKIIQSQYINLIKDGDKNLYQKIDFLPNDDIKNSVWISLNEKLIKITGEMEKMQKEGVDKTKPPKTRMSCFELFVTGLISNVSIFNLKLLNSFFKFLNKYFTDSATIIFGPFIAAIVLFIIGIISIFVTGYYIVYNTMWLVLNSPSENPVQGEGQETTQNSYNYINGVPIFYKSWKNLLLGQWIWWMICCVILGYAVAIIIIPASIIMSTIILLRWLIYILFLPSTYVDYNKPCSVYRMFLDSFIYKRPLISWIMSWIIISTSFDVFDTAGGAIAIIVCILIYFKIIFKFELFDEYVPEADEKAFFTEKPELNDFIPDCVADYTDMDLDMDVKTDNVGAVTSSNFDGLTEKSNGTESNGTESNGTESNGTESNGTESNGTESTEKASEDRQVTNTSTDFSVKDHLITDAKYAKNAFKDAASQAATATNNLFKSASQAANDAATKATTAASQSKTTTVNHVLKPMGNVLTGLGKAAEDRFNRSITNAMVSPEDDKFSRI
jgi:hypothetical protein